ncbi:MAG: CoA transferase [Azospirillum sp.]|nr:CoA transferase [Azospirillum sp.]
MTQSPEFRGLAGILVVAVEQAVAAPFCTSRLADAGARVIKVERPDGDFARAYDHVVHGESAYFVWINRGKESIALDLKTPEDAALLQRMIARADVFVQNLAPGAAERSGFASAALRARHPRLITCDISGYGEGGLYRDMKAYDLLIQAETGLASITGVPERPGRVGVSVADIACGMYAHAGILQALYERERSGRGKGVAVSLFDSLADWMTVPLLHFDYGGSAPPRAGLNHPTIAPYGAYAMGDGKEIVFSIQNQREWRTFCAEVLHRPELADDPRFCSNPARVANRPGLDRELDRVFRTLTRDQARRRLDAARIAYGALNGVDDLSVHPQLRRIEVDTPSGPVASIAPPLRWCDAGGEGEGEGNLRPVPALDQQGAALRDEFARP